MTSDAKIGLLLGLVFIFVIAFIINGLPSFGSRAQNVEAAPVTSFENNSFGLADQTQNAQEQLDWETLLDQGATDEPVVADELPNPVEEVVIPQPETTRADGTSQARSVYDLDGMVSGVSRTIEDVMRGLAEASEAVTMQNQAEEPVPTIDIPRPAPIRIPPARTQSPSATTTPPSRRSVRRTYVVQDGDVLATIAKKVYGPVEGNRLVNIRRIYSANAVVLDSPDEIFVGQKLVIPALPEGVEGTNGPNPTLAEGVFERVESVGRRNLADIRQSQSEGRWYVVQDGDNLWKIASKQLGSGARCDEIAKMNTDTLKDKDVLDIGMRLRLPLK